MMAEAPHAPPDIAHVHTARVQAASGHMVAVAESERCEWMAGYVWGWVTGFRKTVTFGHVTCRWEGSGPNRSGAHPTGYCGRIISSAIQAVPEPPVTLASDRRRSCALTATMMVDNDISAAPIEGGITTPTEKRTPAASGIAKKL